MNIASITAIVGGLLPALLGLVFRKNIEELLKEWGWTTILVNSWKTLRCNLRWEDLRRLWWLWLGVGLGGGCVLIALALWLTPTLMSFLKGSAPVVVTGQIPPDEMQFRLELRKVILSNIDEVMQNWNRMIYITLSEYNSVQGHDQTPISVVFTVLFQGINERYSKLGAIGKIPIEKIDPADTQKSIISFLWAYSDSIHFLHLFEQITGKKADAKALAKLSAASAPAIESLRDLRSSPRANLLQKIEFAPFFQY